MARPRPATTDDDFVDLGLSVKWAKCNLGAKSPEEYGNYYAWGEIAPKKEYTKENSRTYRQRMSCLSGNSQYDAATATSGQGVRLPLLGEIKELREKCTILWSTCNCINGCMVTGPNGSSIFLPAAGDREGMSLEDVGGTAIIGVPCLMMIYVRTTSVWVILI